MVLDGKVAFSLITPYYAHCHPFEGNIFISITS
jgi:hypothetical protein